MDNNEMIKNEPDNTVERKENKMGVLPVNSLLLSMSLPMVASMLVQALYNIVDSIFVARVAEDALTAVSMAFPLQTLMIALAGGTGVGINAILSKSLGEKEYERANKVAVNGIFLSALSYLLFLVIGIFAVRPFYMNQTGDVEIVEYGIQYLTIVLSCSFGIFGQFIFERLLTSTGRTFYTMITQGTGAIINLILDPILIFGLLGAPRDAKYFPNLGFNGIDTSGTAVLCYDGVTAVCTGAKDSDSPSFAIFQGENGWMRLIGKPNVIEGVDYEFADETKPPVPNAAGGMSRAMESGKYDAPKMRHRMTQEFMDFARIVDSRDDAAAAACLERSVAVMTALETARKSAGIRFAVDA